MHHRTTINGSAVHYWTYHDDKQPTILMIHGFRGTHHGLEKIAKNLPDYHLIIPDLPGFGDSQSFAENSEHSLDQYVEFLHQFSRSTAATIVLGHSFGSIIASHYAARYPDEVHRLILVNPISAPALNGPKAVMTKLALFYYWLAEKSPERISNVVLSHQGIVDIMSRQMTVSRDPKLRAFIRQQHRDHFSSFASPKIVSQAFRAAVSNTVTEVVAKISMPTLVIGAKNDQVSSVKTQRAFSKALANGTYVELDDVGHLTHYEQPREVAAAVRAFLKQSPDHK